MSLLFQSGDGDKLLDMVEKSQIDDRQTQICSIGGRYVERRIGSSRDDQRLENLFDIDGDSRACGHSVAVDLSWNFQDE